jgi:hypothetical protein
MVPPAPDVPVALTVPEVRLVPVLDCAVMAPPATPLALVLLDAPRVTLPTALKVMVPPGPATAVLALTIPVWLMSPA